MANVPNGLRDKLKADGKSLEDSLGPTYYPTHPHNSSIFTISRLEGGSSTSGGVDGVGDSNDGVGPSPMNPLQAPWPYLPPILSEGSGDGGRRRQEGGGTNRHRVPTAVRNFLEGHP